MAKAGELPLQGELTISLAAWGIPLAKDSFAGQQPCEMAVQSNTCCFAADLTKDGTANCCQNPGLLTCSQLSALLAKQTERQCRVQCAIRSRSSCPIAHLHRQLAHL